MDIDRIIREEWIAAVFGVVSAPMLLLGAVALTQATPDPTEPQVPPVYTFLTAGVLIAMVATRVFWAITELRAAYEARQRGKGCPDWRRYLEQLAELGHDRLED
jgi:hypothetical protein